MVCPFGCQLYSITTANEPKRTIRIHHTYDDTDVVLNVVLRDVWNVLALQLVTEECDKKMARPEGFEPPTTWFVATGTAVTHCF